MALQKINWTQIDSANVPSGTTVDLGSTQTPIDNTFVKTLYIGEYENPDILHNFHNL